MPIFDAFQGKYYNTYEQTTSSTGKLVENTSRNCVSNCILVEIWPRYSQKHKTLHRHFCQNFLKKPYFCQYLSRSRENTKTLMNKRLFPSESSFKILVETVFQIEFWLKFGQDILKSMKLYIGIFCQIFFKKSNFCQYLTRS